MIFHGFNFELDRTLKFEFNYNLKNVSYLLQKINF